MHVQWVGLYKLTKTFVDLQSTYTSKPFLRKAKQRLESILCRNMTQTRHMVLDLYIHMDKHTRLQCPSLLGVRVT